MNGLSFDSKAREKYLNYDYLLEYNYAQKDISITKVGKNYRIVIDGEIIEGRFEKINAILKETAIFPQRIITFYSGMNNRMLKNLGKETIETDSEYIELQNNPTELQGLTFKRAYDKTNGYSVLEII